MGVHRDYNWIYRVYREYNHHFWVYNWLFRGFVGDDKLPSYVGIIS